MKRLLITCFAFLSVTTLFAQQKEGKVIYDRTVQLQFSFQGMPGGMEQQMPSSRTDKFELLFGNNQSLWKQAEKDNDEDAAFTGENGAHIRMVIAGSDDVLYSNFETGKKVEKREMFDKTFIIDDSLRPLKWKMTGETKSILNHNCMKAMATQVRQTMRMTMDNGKMERKEISDTSAIIAWFTTDIPVSAGPAEYQGQLPGLILEMDINNSKQIFKATDLSEKADIASIKEPTGKKHYTPEEFKKERDRMMEEMQKNMQGGPGMRTIRIN